MGPMQDIMQNNVVPEGRRVYLYPESVGALDEAFRGALRSVPTATDRMQAEWERKRVMRGEAPNYQRGRR
jgi:hypothetical protein